MSGRRLADVSSMRLEAADFVPLGLGMRPPFSRVRTWPVATRGADGGRSSTANQGQGARRTPARNRRGGMVAGAPGASAWRSPSRGGIFRTAKAGTRSRPARPRCVLRAGVPEAVPLGRVGVVPAEARLGRRGRPGDRRADGEDADRRAGRDRAAGRPAIGPPDPGAAIDAAVVADVAVDVDVAG